MAYTPTSLLSLPIITTGSESGLWGDVTNNGLTQYLDIAIAGRNALTSANFTAGALTLANTAGTNSTTNIAATSAQYSTLYVSSLATNSTITAPSSNRNYLVINADSTYTLTVKASGQTGITFSPGQSGLVAFNGTDYALVGTIGPTVPVARGGTGATTLTANNVILGNGTSAVNFVAPGSNGNVLTSNGTTWTSAAGSSGTVSSVGGTGSVQGLTLSGTVTTSGNLTLGGSLSAVSLSSQVSGTLPVSNGGTGATSLTANNVILGNGSSAVQFVAPGTSGNVLTSNGTTWASSTPASSGTTSSGSFVALRSNFTPYLGNTSAYPAGISSFVFPSAANANNYDVKTAALYWSNAGSNNGISNLYRPVWNAYLGQWVVGITTVASSYYSTTLAFAGTNGAFYQNNAVGVQSHYSQFGTHTIYNPYTYTTSIIYTNANVDSIYILTFPVNFSGSTTNTQIYTTGAGSGTITPGYCAFIDGGSSGSVEYVAIGYDNNAGQLKVNDSTNGTSWTSSAISATYSGVSNFSAQTNNTAAYFFYYNYLMWRLRGSGWYTQNLGSSSTYAIRSFGCNNSYLCFTNLANTALLWVSAAGGTTVSFTSFTPTTSGAPTGGTIAWYEIFWNGTAWIGWANVGMFYNTNSNPNSGTWVFVSGSPQYPFNQSYGTFLIGIR